MAGSAGCAALATGDAAAFGVTVHSDGTVDFALSATAGAAPPLLLGAPVPIQFHGPAGSWNLSGLVRTATTIHAAMPAGDQALGMVLTVLGGGALSAGDPTLGLPELNIPPAGTAGTTWFRCARDREHG